jgi:hypothetical protein
LSIAAHGRETVVKNHTYERRVREMMNIILLDSYEQIKSKLETRKQNISELLKKPKEIKSFTTLLCSFPTRNRFL